MKIAFIHHDKKLSTGAHYINDLMSRQLRAQGVTVKHFYPRGPLFAAPDQLRGLRSILFFHSLLEHKDEILKCDLVQGTTYTPLALLPFGRPVISHFGSTTAGWLRAVPQTHLLEKSWQAVWRELQAKKIIPQVNIKTRRPLRDIAEIEFFVAWRAQALIATSRLVAEELRQGGIGQNRIHVIHNAVDDLWWQGGLGKFSEPALVWLGRLGRDVFTYKLKGLDRLAGAYRKFKDTPKATFALTASQPLKKWLAASFSHHCLRINLPQTDIREHFRKLRGSILLITSRYEGFSLSMLEGMAQGLVPVTFPVGVAPEIITNGENGFLVSSQLELEKAVKDLLENSELRQRLSAAAVQTARRFRSDNIVRDLTALYRNLLENQRAKKNGHNW